jgi:15-cis-phytoene synthase
MTGDIVTLEATRVLARSGKTFRWAGRFLGREALEEAAIVYATCRAIDDAADENSDDAVAFAALGELEGMLMGERTPSPLISAFREVAERQGFGLEPVLVLLAAARRDRGRVRITNWPDLDAYCYAVAGTVGVMMCGILGVRDPDARAPAVDLGKAMQLTNISRDVLEDARRDRVYLPTALNPDVLVQEIRDGRIASFTRDHVRAAVELALAQAEKLYAHGRSGMRFIPWRSRLAIAVAARVYRAIGTELLRRGGDPLQGRVVVPGWRRLLLTLSALSETVWDALRNLIRPSVSLPQLSDNSSGSRPS